MAKELSTILANTKKYVNILDISRNKLSKMENFNLYKVAKTEFDSSPDSLKNCEFLWYWH